MPSIGWGELFIPVRVFVKELAHEKKSLARVLGVDGGLETAIWVTSSGCCEALCTPSPQDRIFVRNQFLQRRFGRGRFIVGGRGGLHRLGAW